MIIGRLLAGIGIGVTSAVVPLYISEVVLCSFYRHCDHVYFFEDNIFQHPLKMQISPTEIRGTLGSVNQLFICIGILAALVAGLPLAGNPLWYFFLIEFFLVSHLLSAIYE